jgi:hypothetical protein
MNSSRQASLFWDLGKVTKSHLGRRVDEPLSDLRERDQVIG